MDATMTASESTVGVPDGFESKEPWLGANLSMLFPGLGAWYGGARAQGGLEFGAALALFGSGLTFALAPRLNAVVGIVLILGVIPLWLFSLWSAHHACRRRAAPGFDALRRGQRDGWKAVFLSHLLPGLGQLYDRRLAIGVPLLVAALVLVALDGPIPALLYGSLVAAACIEAWHGSRARRAGSARALPLIAAVAFATICSEPLVTGYLKSHVVRAFNTASASMSPTIEPGDRVFADLRARGRARIGDIVVIPLPTHQPERPVLKTVLAVAGDVVEFRVDGAYRNGERVIEGWMPPADIANIAFGREGVPFPVPEGTIFVIGDNYARSNDSRYFGAVALEEVKGRVYKIYWPPGRMRAF